MTVLCFLLLASVVTARRHKVSDLLEHEGNDKHGLDHGASNLVKLEEDGARKDLSHAWCISGDATLTCPDGKVLRMRTAFYNRRQMPGCQSPVGADSSMGCKEKATAIETVRALCNGHQSCNLPASMHKRCPENPFTFMRVLYRCADGNAAENDEEVTDVAVHGTDSDPKKGSATKHEANGCISEGIRLSCRAKETVRVRTAFFNRYQMTGCKPMASSPMTACKADVSQTVKDLCRERGPSSSCEVKPDDVAACPENPFTQMRVLYACVHE
eukprot:CAMPEP_0197905238 /NCGR_PEP_ID=MMETSP1439-20131203/59829_1 /TAXON_ID=66791 /ORGANISM="Gonyaulax spinifera, Strain CCMP409" /LENGTH=270 /DNA_ID=CAMNT_0043526499 /DNA_START=83 /DNA_END=895 /DNA_ORIENTATION=-